MSKELNTLQNKINQAASELAGDGKITGGFRAVAALAGVDYATVKGFARGDIKRPVGKTVEKLQACVGETPARELNKDDQVAAPSHYRQGQIECIDAIRESMSAYDFAGYCKGNVIKYTWRAHNHNEVPLVHLNKAADYLRWWIEIEGQIVEAGDGRN